MFVRCKLVNLSWWKFAHFGGVFSVLLIVGFFFFHAKAVIRWLKLTIYCVGELFIEAVSCYWNLIINDDSSCLKIQKYLSVWWVLYVCGWNNFFINPLPLSMKTPQFCLPSFKTLQFSHLLKILSSTAVKPLNFHMF